MYYIGIDLAWSANNPSGVAVVREENGMGTLEHLTTCHADEEIQEIIEEHVGDEEAIATVDAPLIVPNEEGKRLAEERVNALFRTYNAGAHPANRKRLSQWTGRVRGEEIAAMLEEMGFAHDPDSDSENGRRFFEVYPHPSMVVLFNLETVLPYKKKGGRDYETVWEAFERFQENLAALENADPALSLPAEVTEKGVREVRGKALKTYEDKLDAIFCAYIAQYADRHPESCAVLGNMDEGYILTPLFEEMWGKLKRTRGQQTIDTFS